MPIVFHDNTLERMANSELVVNNTPWEQLQNIDISINHLLRYSIGVILHDVYIICYLQGYFGNIIINQLNVFNK